MAWRLQTAATTPHSSCVIPYDSPGQASVTTTYYQPGYRIDSLPRGYRSEVIAGSDYYYYNGAYYRPHANGYVVVDAPRASRYYTEYGHYRGSGDARYSNDPRAQRSHNRSAISRLPSDYRVVNHGGNEYYQSGEKYFQRQGSGYIEVSRPY